MKTILNVVLSAIVIITIIPEVYAQHYNKPFTIEALNHRTNPSALSRSMGGLTVSSRNDVSTMFSNPAAMQTIEGIQFSIGSGMEYKRNEQSQQWYNLDWQPAFYLFMEGKTADFRSPIVDPTINPPAYWQDTLPRNGRNPNWNRIENQIIPPQAFAAIPFEVSGRRFFVGIGFIEYANVNYYYANRTALSRNLDYITLPLSSRTTDYVPVDFYADERIRDGSIYGYGGAIAFEIDESLSLGMSFMYLSGTISDTESRDHFGRIDFYYNDFHYTDNPYRLAWQSTSEVSGLELTCSGIYRTKNLLFSISLTPPSTITRDFTTTGDSTRGSTKTSISGDKGADSITLPLRGSLGIGINLRSNVFLSAEYKYYPYTKTEYSDKSGTVTTPWSDCSTIHFGLEYLPVDDVSVRFGYQTKSEVFEQQGNPLPGEPITAVVYSAGVGIALKENIQLNLGYEYMNMHYEDNWRVNSNITRNIRNTFFGSLTYTIK